MAKTKIKYISHAGFQITPASGKILYLDPFGEFPKIQPRKE